MLNISISFPAFFLLWFCGFFFFEREGNINPLLHLSMHPSVVSCMYPDQGWNLHNLGAWG